MKNTSMKKHFWSSLAAIIITLIFAGGVYVVIRSGEDRILFLIMFGLVYLTSLGLLFSIVFSKKRQGHIIVNEHSK